jgi:hypothetical protein
LNTVLDHQIFESICDQNSSSRFTANDVYTATPSPAGAWATLLAQRDAGTLGSSTALPFLGLASGNIATGDTQYANGLNINDTLLASTPGAPPQPRALQAASLAPKNPYFYDQIMAKIANQVTNRSHVFAVYLTVGFFRVLSDPAVPAGTLPVKLGGEIGARNTPPTNIRHHLFAIVDRSALTQLQISQQFQAVTTTGSDITFQSPITTGPLSQTVKVGALSSSAGVQPAWSIQVGTRVQVGSETVTVTAVNPLAGASSLTANFMSQHPSGTNVSVPVETSQTTSATAVNAPGSTTVTVGAVSGSGWSIQPGMQVFVDLYPNQEVVTVSSIDTTAKTFTANFARTHSGTPPYQVFIPVPNTNSQYDVLGGGAYAMYVNALSDGGNGPIAWKIQAGSIVTVDSGANQETVQVITTDPGTKFFAAYFNKAHSGGCGVYVPKFGNPGPQPNFSAKDNSAVVLYAAVID